MSNEHAIALIMGLFIPAVLVYVFLDRSYQNRLDAVATGVVQGVRAPAKYRELLLYTRLLPFVAVVVFFFNTLLSIIWMRHFVAVLRQAEAD